MPKSIHTGRSISVSATINAMTVSITPRDMAHSPTPDSKIQRSFVEALNAILTAEGSTAFPMFTGIIEEVGRVVRIEQRDENRHITVEAKHAPTEMHTGDSIAVSGVCLTALDIKAKSFSADLAPETWARTSRSEEHTSELQSQSNLVCRLLLEKKKNKQLTRSSISHLHARLQLRITS